jgi:MFS family permease
MIRSSRPPSTPADPTPSITLPGQESSPYGVTFWRAYMANLLVMVAMALLFRYADFVTLLGGSEWHLGWIVGAGVMGSLAMRLVLGAGIDRYGPRRVWLASLGLLAASCFAHLVVHRYDGPAIYLLRILFCSAAAGVFGSTMTFISGTAPVRRMAEMIGMLGTAGFVGIVLGTQLGDLLCGTEVIQRTQVDRMFLAAGTLSLAAMAFVWTATWGYPAPAIRRRPPLFWIIRRYHPGTVLLVGVAMGVGISLPTTFLRTYAAELGIAKIGLFFAVYAPAAILTRVLTRRLPERIGLMPMILLGLAALVAGQLLMLVVQSEWYFVFPGLGYGVAHALLFPTVIAAGSRTFPNRHRGLGTTLMLAMYDVGQLIGAPSAGAILHFSTNWGLPGYPTLFVVVAMVLGGAGLVFALTGRRQSDRQRPRDRIRHQAWRPEETPSAEPECVEVA